MAGVLQLFEPPIVSQIHSIPPLCQIHIYHAVLFSKHLENRRLTMINDRLLPDISRFTLSASNLRSLPLTVNFSQYIERDIVCCLPSALSSNPSSTPSSSYFYLLSAIVNFGTMQKHKSSDHVIVRIICVLS